LFQFLRGKLINNKWLVLSLLIANVLLVGIAASSPLYSEATLNRMLVKDMEDYQISRNAYPAKFDLTVRMGVFAKGTETANYLNARDTLFPQMAASFGIPEIGRLKQIKLSNVRCAPDIARDNSAEKYFDVMGLSGFEGYIHITAGQMYSPDIEDGVLTCVVHQAFLDSNNLLLGDEFTMEELVVDGKPLRLKITGIFEQTEDSAKYVRLASRTLVYSVFAPVDVLESRFIDNYATNYRAEADFTAVLDYRSMFFPRIRNYQSADALCQSYVKSSGGLQYTNLFMPILQGYGDGARKLNTTLWVLEVPVFVMLVFFIFMVSRQILTIEQNEISVVKSRGAGRRQILLVYLAQGAVISGAGFLLGIPLGVFICKALGASNGFLNMVSRAALHVRVNPGCFIYAGIAAVFSALTMLLPVINRSKVTIVDHKRALARNKSPLWKRFFLDIICLGASVYALYNFTRTSGLLAAQPAGARSVDPLLYLSSSLFIIGLSLLCLRLFPLLVRLIFRAGRPYWPPEAFAAFLRVIRSTGEEQFIMIFLVFTLALGVFDAKAARTINLNQEDMIRYQVGADIVLSEPWASNKPPAAAPGAPPEASGTAPAQIIYTEPDFSKYRLPEAASAAKVQRSQTVRAASAGGTISNVQMMAIDSKAFGETAWTRDDLFAADFREYLNRLALDPRGVLLSMDFKEKYGYKTGDSFQFSVPTDNGDCYVAGIVFGFVEYWPGYARFQKVKAADGTMTERRNPLVVANLNYVQSICGIMPYEVWIKSAAPSNNYIYSFAAERGIKFAVFKDADAMITEAKNTPVAQGTNGVLTVGFITILLVCFVGFLIYWILSIKSRVLQFGVFRAMGMTMGGVLRLLVNEQALISVVAIALGVGVGQLASRLFVPLIQMSYLASEQLIPFVIVIEPQDYARLFTVTGLMLAAGVTALGMLISRIKIAQALKLGED